MAGINTGSFFSRLGGQMPGMVNSMAQRFGAPDMEGTVRGSSALLNRAPKNKVPSMGKVTNGIPKGQMPGTPVNIQAPPMMNAEMPSTGGIDTRPSPQFGIPGGFDFVRGNSGNSGGINFPGFGGGFWNPSAPKLDPMTGQYNTPSAPQLGGLFGAYNRIRF